MKRRVCALVAMSGLIATGCSNRPGESTTITVFAAASLQATFTRLGAQFETANPGTTVMFNFGGSSDLVAQLQDGASADVFAAADTVTMDKAVAAGLLSARPAVFATNSMEIAVPPGNPAGVTSFVSLADPGIAVVVCAPQVPCGAATRTVEQNVGVALMPVSEENSVTHVLGKVISGEADAGVVYVSDVISAGDAVDGVPIPTADNATNDYPIGVLKGSTSADDAGEFQAYVLGPEGQQVLAEGGFGTPS